MTEKPTLTIGPECKSGRIGIALDMVQVVVEGCGEMPTWRGDTVNVFEDRVDVFRPGGVRWAQRLQRRVIAGGITMVEAAQNLERNLNRPPCPPPR